jgi:broad specificity phosphatase PhoE
VILAVRHGATDFNVGGPSKERVRAWANVPLNAQGRRESKAAALLTAPFALKAIITSDLQRCLDTAADVQELHPHIPLISTMMLRPINVGKLTGALYKDATPILAYHFQHPDEVIPGGESFRDFMQRCIPLLQTLVEQPVCYCVICHNPNIKLLRGMEASHGKELDHAFMDISNPHQPGSVILVSQDYTISPLASSPPVPQTKAGSLS